MKHKQHRKFVALVMLVMFIMGTAAPAMADPTGGVWDISDIPGCNGGLQQGQKGTIYFGAPSGAPLQWRVLSNSGGEVFLLSDKILHKMIFDDWTGRWKDVPDVRSYLSANCNLYFNNKEREAIRNTTHSTGGSGPYKDEETTDKLFLLSYEEATKGDYGLDTKGARKSTTSWWLRSSHSATDYAYFVDDSGNISGDDVDYPDFGRGVRPAFNLDASKILFLTAAQGGKGDVEAGDGFTLSSYGGNNGFKVTLKDDSMKTPVANVMFDSDGFNINDIAELAKTQPDKHMKISGDVQTGYAYLVVNYANATFGKNMYLSALLYNTDNSLLNYAKVATIDTADEDTGVAVIDLQDIQDGSYKVNIYAEQENGDYLTDYASSFALATPFSFTKDGSIGTVITTLGSNYADEGLTASLLNNAKLGFNTASYDTSIIVEEGEHGEILAASSGSTLTGNITLEKGATLAASGDGNFKLTGNLNFNLDGDHRNEVFVTVADGKVIDLEGAKVNLIQTDKGYKLAKGQTMTLISNAQNYTGPAKIRTRVGLKQYLYSVGLAGSDAFQGANGNDAALVLGYVCGAAVDETKSFGEARLGVSAALNSAADLIASSVVQNAKSEDWAAFVSLAGSHSRYETGSHVDLNMFNVAAGLSKLVFDNFTLGVFAEGGSGRYNTTNNFATGDVTADGNINYFGGGVFAKVEGKKTDLGQLHGEASFRAGHVSSKYNSDNIIPGSNTSFDMSGAYLGAHAGFGYKWAMGKDGASNIDTYMKYLWTRQNSNSAMIDGENFDFDAINSHRLRAGFRYNTKQDENGFNFFGGLAYEYEFDGKAKGHTADYSLLEPDFKGGSGMAEIGFKFEREESPWKGEFAVQGFTGKRDSIGATLNVWYMFGK